MHKVICAMGTSLDGYVVGPDGRFDWSAPDEETFGFVLEEFRRVGVHLLGRRLYETMRYWELPENEPSWGEAEREWAALWRTVPKVVFSLTLPAVDGTCRLATRDLAEEIAAWREQPGDGDIAVGGADLAQQAAGLGVVDEYQLRVYPVLVGGGTPLFPREGRRVDLDLVESRDFAGGVRWSRYRVVR